MIQYVIFSISEALTNLWRSRVLNVLSIGTIVLAIFILGSFLFLGVNLKKITLGWEDHIQFQVFLEDEIDDNQRDYISTIIESNVKVSDHAFLSKDDAFKRFQGEFASYQDVTASLQSNPFPASFQVNMIRGAAQLDFERLKSE